MLGNKLPLVLLINEIGEFEYDIAANIKDIDDILKRNYIKSNECIIITDDKIENKIVKYIWGNGYDDVSEVEYKIYVPGEYIIIKDIKNTNFNYWSDLDYILINSKAKKDSYFYLDPSSFQRIGNMETFLIYPLSNTYSHDCVSVDELRDFFNAIRIVRKKQKNR